MSGWRWLSPNDPTEPFADRAYAPPMRVRIWDGQRLRAPFVYPLVLEDRLERMRKTAEAAARGWGQGSGQ